MSALPFPELSTVASVPGLTDSMPCMTDDAMRPALLNPLFAPVTSLPGVGPKQDKLLRYLLSRDETPRLVDLLLHLPASVIDRRARPKISEAVQGTMRAIVRIPMQTAAAGVLALCRVPDRRPPGQISAAGRFAAARQGR